MNFGLNILHMIELLSVYLFLLKFSWILEHKTQHNTLKTIMDKHLFMIINSSKPSL